MAELTREQEVQILHDHWRPSIVKWGMTTNLIGLGLLFLPALFLFLDGHTPVWSMLMLTMIARLPSVAMFYVIEPVSYFSALGLAGTYMANLVGNNSNMRVPCSICAQEAVDFEQGSPKGQCVATVGIAVSVIVNLVILTLTVVAGTALFEQMSRNQRNLLGLLLPALFGGLCVTNGSKYPKIAAIFWPLVIFLNVGNSKIGREILGFGPLDWMPPLGRVPFINLFAVFGAMALGLWMLKRGMLDDKK